MLKDRDIKIELSNDERGKLSIRLWQQIASARDGMVEMLRQIRQWEKLYESDLPEKTFPWQNCSNLNVPLIQSHVDSWHAQINDVILKMKPITLVRPPSYVADPTAKVLAQKVENVLRCIEIERMCLARDGDQWNLNSLMQHAGIAKVAWREEYRSVTKVGKDGRAVRGQEEKYRAPSLELVDMDNFVVYPLTAKSVEKAELIGDRYKLSELQLQEKIDSGFFDKEIGDELFGLLQREGTQQEVIVDDLKEREGIEDTIMEGVWLWEVIAPYDADKDGIAEDCIFTLAEDNGQIVRATEFPYHHGRRYYIRQLPFIRSRTRFFGRSLPGILEGLQQELNAIHNQRIDGVTLAMTKAFKRLRTSENPHDISLYPGANIYVDDKDEITEFEISPIVPGRDEEETALEWSQRASPINDTGMGKTADNTGHTAREVTLVAAKGALRISDVVERLQEGYVELAKQVLGLMAQFMDDEELFQHNLSREELSLPWEFLPHGDLGAADKQAKKAEATELYMMLLNPSSPNPLVVSDLRRVYRLTLDVLNAHDKPDPEAYIGSEQDLDKMLDMMQQQAEAEVAMVEAEQGSAGNEGIRGDQGRVGSVGGQMESGQGMGAGADRQMPSNAGITR